MITIERQELLLLAARSLKCPTYEKETCRYLHIKQNRAQQTPVQLSMSFSYNVERSNTSGVLVYHSCNNPWNQSRCGVLFNDK